jgi:hypothetical protein
MKIEMAGRFLAKFANITCYQNRFIRSQVTSCTRTDGAIIIGGPKDCERSLEEMHLEDSYVTWHYLILRDCTRFNVCQFLDKNSIIYL